ncbi:alpha/beta hydrolase [Candidatus Saccharibacteria bacterium]|nr:alpha/beta hydrolase [Candidatus Saccharibacteria bacterium]
MTLYIIHGWTYTVAPWEATIRELKNYGINVKMLNVPGLTAPSKKVWTVEEYAKWADQNIPDGAIALGHSNGGRILLNLLSQKPAKLKKVILLDSAGIYEESKKRDFNRKISKVFAPLKKVAPLRKVYHKLLGASDYDKAPDNMKKTLANMLDSDRELDITKVTTPAVVLWGKQDTVTPPRQGEKMAKLLPNSTITFYENWTHAPYLVDAKGLARAIAKCVGVRPSEVPKNPHITDVTKNRRVF